MKRWIVLTLLAVAYGRNEHRHQSWCNLTPIRQEVAGLGCESQHVENNVCVGACFSYAVPRTFPASPGDLQDYCDACKPSETTWKSLTLECEDGATVSKLVQLVHNCSCSNCHHEDINPRDNMLKEEPVENEIPELLSQFNKMKTHRHHHKHHKHHHNHLNQVQEEFHDEESEHDDMVVESTSVETTLPTFEDEDDD